MSTDLADLHLIWEPLRIGPTEVKHRIMATAHTILYGEDNILSDRHIAYYRERAMGGAALLITEQQGAHRLSKGSFHRGCSAWEKRVIPQYAKLADAVHEFGAKQFVQLFACGVHDSGMTIMDEWHPLWAVSRVPSTVFKETPMVMEAEHIRDVVKGYGESALNVKVAGLDGVEIHGAHGYLVGQFLSRAYNRRTDAYGGSVENRCRFALEVAEEIRRQVGSEITVGLRMSFDEFLGDAGITPSESEEALEVLAASGLFDFFNISGGSYYTLNITVASMIHGEGYFVPFGKRAREIVGDRAKIFIVGGIRDLRLAETILAEGASDMVGMTRAHIADPFLVTKAREGREREMIRCVAANFCVIRARDQREVTCMMNPATGRERKWGHGTLVPVAAGAEKRILVAGGGPAGMQLAHVAARRGHSVVLVEREQLGGCLNFVKQLPTRANWQVAIDNLSRAVENTGVEVRMAEVTPESLRADAPDAVVCATGSTWERTGFSPYRPERDGIPGADGANVLDVEAAGRRAVADPAALGSRVLIIDESDSYLPLGLAEILAQAGVDVEIVTPHLYVGEEMIRTLELGDVMPRIAKLGVRMTAQQFVESIDGRTVELYDIWSRRPRRVEEVDTVVLSIAREPDDALFHAVRSEFPEVHLIGDAVAPRLPAAAIYEGEELGRAI